MRINKKIVLLAAGVVVVAGAISIYTIAQNSGARNARDDAAEANPVSAADVPEDQRPTEVTANEEGQKVSPDGSTVVGQNPQDAPTSTVGQSIVLTHVSQSGGTLMVRAQVLGVTTGTCQLTLTQSDHHTITKTAPVALVAANYACEGFDVPVSELPHDGDWTVRVGLQDTSIASDTKTVSITK